MKPLCMYIITQLFLSVCLFAQPLSPKLVLEIAAEKANYYKGDHQNVIGPNAIDIDQNGDIYIGGGSHIFVYNKDGKHLRTITSRRYFRRIHDIAVGTDDKLYVLVGKKIFLVEKNKGDEEGISIVACYSFRMASFSGISVTDDNQCLLSRSQKDYYALSEADMELNEKSLKYSGFPFYTSTLNNLYHGQPLKSSGKVVFLSDKREAIDLTFRNVVSQETTAEVIDERTLEYQRLNLKYNAQTHKRFADMIPAPKRERYQSIRAKEIIGSGNSDKLFVRLSAKPLREYAKFTENGYIIRDQFFCVMTKSGKFISIIENIPKDLVAVNNISDKGKSFSIGPDERLYYLYTEGDIDNLDSCVTRVVRW